MYKRQLLSNTDDIHIERVNSTVPDVGEFLSLFEKVYYSQDTGYRKPEKEWLVCYKVLLLHPLSRTGAAMY